MLLSIGLQAGAAYVNCYIGRVTDARWGTPIAGALVYAKTAHTGVMADASASFSLCIPGDTVSLWVSAAGYVPAVFSGMKAGEPLQLMLKPSALSSVFSSGLPVAMAGYGVQHPGQSGFNYRQVEKLPALIQPDYLKYLQTHPGVQKGNDGGSIPLVRGGNTDQNLYLMDGVQVYNPFHCLSYFSAFNKNIVREVSLQKSGFGSATGGRLSSVTNVRLAEGNIRQWGGGGSLAPGTADLHVDGPIGKKASLLLAGRRSYVDLLLKPFYKDTGDASIGYILNDVNAKLVVNLKRNRRLVVNGYSGGDNFYIAAGEYVQGSGVLIHRLQTDRYGWNNRLAAATLQNQRNSRTQTHLRMYYTSYRFAQSRSISQGLANSGKKDSTDRLEIRSGVADLGLNADAEYNHTGSDKVYAGVAVVVHHLLPGQRNNRLTVNGQVLHDTTRGFANTLRCPEVAAYMDWHRRLSSSEKWVAGLRPTWFANGSSNFFYADIHLLYEKHLNDKKTTWWLTADLNHQPLHQTGLNDQGMPTDSWVPATKKFKPQQCLQVAAAVSKKIASSYELSSSVFYKKMNNLAMLAQGATQGWVLTDWDSKMAKATGRAYGLECQLTKKEGIVTGYLSYTLLWSQRKYAETTQQTGFGIWEDASGWFNTRYGRRHDLSLVLQNKITRKGMLCILYTLSAGEFTNVPNATYRMPLYNPILDNWNGQTVYNQGSRNNYRLPAYQRVDVSWMVDRRSQVWKGTSVGISVYNLFNNLNPTGVNLRTNRRGQTTLQYSSLWPIVPSMYYTFRF